MKVYLYKILKVNEEEILYHEDFGPLFYDKFHQHEAIQISYIEKGEGRIFVGDAIKEFQEGDIIALGSNLPHVFRNEVNENEKAYMQSIYFTPNFFEENVFKLSEFKSLQPFLESLKNGFKIEEVSSKLVKQFKKFKNADGFERLIIFFKIIKHLSISKKMPLSSFIYEKKFTDVEGKKMQSVFEYVMTNYQKSISLEEIASISNMTKNAFCRYFKARTNKTFFEFLIEIRIESASKLLLKNKEFSVLEIAELCGFNNISNFNRKFKEIKDLSPLQYRKIHN